MACHLGSSLVEYSTFAVSAPLSKTTIGTLIIVQNNDRYNIKFYNLVQGNHN